MTSKRRKSKISQFPIPKSAAGGGGDGFDPNEKKKLEVNLSRLLTEYGVLTEEEFAVVKTYWEELGSFFSALSCVERDVLVLKSIVLAEYCYDTQGVSSSQILDGIENEIKTGQRFCDFIFG